MGSQPDLDSIAIVGMAGRFPGAADLAQYWRNLLGGVESIRRFGREELLAAGVRPADLAHPDFVPCGSILDQVDLFDAGFFGYSPREAARLDPQQRIFLECCWHALEDAGCPPGPQGAEMGVYAGASQGHYWRLRRPWQDPAGFGAGQFALGLEDLLGNDKDYLATRVAYKLNLRGPAIGVQTACSTSLVAVCLAAQALLSYQCDAALAGGVAVRLPQVTGYFYEEGGILPPDGHCRPYDKKGAGPVFGNGVAALVLKRLEDALERGDRIRAVIRGWAVNNDGAAKAGYSAPSVQGQAGVISLALQMAEVEPGQIGFVEGHGTGTPLGDAIEAAALNQVFGQGRCRPGSCPLGSAKGNIGHLETVAGAAGLIKTVLAMETGQIPGTLNYSRPNPEVDFSAGPFFVNSEPMPWPAEASPRLAGVSSFGIGGTNAHLVLEQAPPLPALSPGKKNWHLLPLSARDPRALKQAARDLAGHLRRHPSQDLAGVAQTLAQGRGHWEHRLALAARTPEQAAQALETCQGPGLPGEPTGEPPDGAAFLFPGGGSQHLGMARGLYQSQPVFRQQLEQCSRLLQPRLGLSLPDLLYGQGQGELLDPAVALPALFAVEYSLARLWMHWGLEPKALIGHSLGEYSAACLAGVFSLADGLALTALRGRLMGQLPPGAMLSVAASESQLRQAMEQVGGPLDLAAVNAPRLSVAAGPSGSIQRLAEHLRAQGLDCRQVAIGVAAHSRQVEAMLEPFVEAVAAIRLGAPRIPLASNLTGGWLSDREATDPAYWGRHLRSCVRFGDGMAALLQGGRLALLECGPGHTLTNLAQQQPAAAGRPVFTSLPHKSDPGDDLAHALATLGGLWSLGLPVDPGGPQGEAPARPAALPLYPFQRKRYWLENPPKSESAPLAREEDIGRWFHASILAQAPLPPGPGPDKEALWLLAGQNATASTLAEALRNTGCAVALARPGKQLRREGPGLFCLEQASRLQWSELLQILAGEQGRALRVLDLRPLDAGQAASGQEAMEAHAAWLPLAQAAAQQAQRLPCRLATACQGFSDPVGTGGASPAWATLAGAVNVLRSEEPGLMACLVDLDREPASGARALLAELGPWPGEPLAVWRKGVRWVRGFHPYELPPLSGPLPGLAQGGAYLITGGLGAMGLALAKALAQNGAKSIALAGRTQLPPVDQWEKEALGSGPLPGGLRELLALGRGGCRVAYFPADLSRPGEAARLLDQARQSMGSLNGVVHAAGVLRPALLSELDPAELGQDMAAKTIGAWELGQAVGPDISFLVFCSSINGTLGPASLGNYAAANCYLDALAGYLRARGLPALSLAWDGWKSAGLAVAQTRREDLPPQVRQRLAGELAAGGMEPEQGAEAFLRSLASGQAALAASPSNFPARARLAARTRLPAEAPDPGPGQPPSDRARSYQPPQGPIEMVLADIWARFLGLDKVGRLDNFFQLGGHSMLGTRLMAATRAAFGVQLALKELFQRPSVAQLAQRIEGLLAARAMKQEREPAQKDQEFEEEIW